MKKFLVTGGAGFIGSHIVDRLVDEGNEVIIVDNLTGGTNINPKAEFLQCDISKDRPLFENDDTVFHLAALARVQPSIETPLEYHKVNVNGLLDILSVAVEYNIKKFIHNSKIFM